MLEDGLTVIGPVYAPLYRADAKGDDLARAFLIYLKNTIMAAPCHCIRHRPARRVIVRA
jgi:hypothetical protein